MRVDVAILGAGLSGNLLARQIRREVPQASVMLVDPKTETEWKVGESTVEIAAHYLARRHGLGTYLLDRHLPKYGLRFFFDDAARSLAIDELSEVGTDRPPPRPSFQLDRARFEADLREMNADAGVTMRLGERARAITLGEGGAPHRFEVGGEAHEARWLFDATGRARTVGRDRDLLAPEERHRIGAIWGRFEGVTDLDHVGGDAWHERVRFTTRSLSTNHFMYEGYWIWLIPLGRGVTSVGVVGERDVFRRGMRTEAGFRAFLSEHRAVRELLEGATMLDLAGHTQLAYGSRRFFDGAGRWALLGDAAAFTDPFYSPGSDFIAIECDFAADLVRRDLVGAPPDEVTEVAETQDRFMQYRWEATMRLYRDLYRCFGSYGVMRAKLNFDLGCYYNLWLDPILSDRHRDPRFLLGELRRAKDTMVALDRFRDLFNLVAADLRQRGAYHAQNRGQYNRGVDCLLELIEEIGAPRKKRLVNRRTEEVFHYGREAAMKLLGPEPVSPGRPWRLYEYGDDRALHLAREPRDSTSATEHGNPAR